MSKLKSKDSSNQAGAEKASAEPYARRYADAQLTYNVVLFVWVIVFASGVLQPVILLLLYVLPIGRLTVEPGVMWLIAVSALCLGPVEWLRRRLKRKLRDLER